MARLGLHVRSVLWVCLGAATVRGRLRPSRRPRRGADQHRGSGGRQRRIRHRAADAAGGNVDSALRRPSADVQRTSRRRNGDGQRQHAGVPAEGAARVHLRGLAGPVQRGNVPVGLQHQQRGRVLAGANDRGEAEHRDDGDLHEQPRQHEAAEAAHRRPDPALGRSAGDDGRQQLRERTAAGATVHATLRRPDPGRRAPSRRRGSLAVRRTPGRLVDAGLRPEGQGVRDQRLQLPESTRADDALVSRPRAGDRPPQRLRRPGRHLLPARPARHGPGEQPDHASVRALRKSSS